MSENGLKQLTKEQLSFKDPAGTPNINKVKDWNKLDKNAKDGTLSEITKKSIVTGGITNGKVVGNGVEFDTIQFWKIDKTSINNCIKCSYDGIKLKFQHADSILTNESASTNIDNFYGYEDVFSVEKADSFLSDCIRVDNIKDSEFRVSSQVEITTKSNVNLKITDCTFNEYQFSGKGKITVDKSSGNPQYVMENGTFIKAEDGYNESVESDNSVAIETDKVFGFQCLTITPAGSYFYSDRDLRKDFAVNIPKESGVYRLCLRKSKAQLFKDYNGLVDFVEKNIELNGIVNYLRYPLKNNQTASLLSSFVYRGLRDINALLSYDNNMVFLDSIFLTNKKNINGNLSIAYPSNYYSIKEMEIGNEIHSVIQLKVNLKKGDLEQNINYNYGTGYFEPTAAIKGNVLVQDNGKNRLTILPPEHEKISGMWKDG
ncbi:hypothetical protein HYT53_00650 [Candidatus Woesearchaeota archaeon]|nr:hypothetical protein [Candidatus Woesearchaeota archaeon]